MIKWVKTGKEVTEVSTTITYAGVDTGVTFESRKRQIAHANRSGTWDYTSYFVLLHGVVLAEKNSLRDAKEYAEHLFIPQKDGLMQVDAV